MVLMKFALLIAFEFCLIEGKCPGSKLSDKDVQLMLDMHNKYRSQLANGKARMKHGYAPSAKNMYKVKWSCDLERQSQDWLDQCVLDTDGTPGHSPKESRKGNGENWSGGWGSPNPAKHFAESATGWWDELRKHGNAQRLDTTKYGLGHWRQMAIGKLTEIGCGIAECEYKMSPSSEEQPHASIICQYRQPNYPGETYERGKPCKKDADCTTYPDSKCEVKEGLCIAKAGAGVATKDDDD